MNLTLDYSTELPQILFLLFAILLRFEIHGAKCAYSLEDGTTHRIINAEEEKTRENEKGKKEREGGCVYTGQ